MVPGDVAVAVFVVEDAEASLWTVKATAGDIAVDGVPIPVDSGALGAAGRERAILQFRADDLSREEYSHLDVLYSVTGVNCILLLLDQRLLGCIEIVVALGNCQGRPLWRALL